MSLTDEIRTLTWRSGKDFLDEVVSLRVPTKIMHTTVLKWKALQWDLLDLSHIVGSLNDVRQKRNRSVFVVGVERDKGGMLSKHIAAHTNRYTDIYRTNVTLEDFLVSAADTDTYMYWTGRLKDWEEKLNNTADIPTWSSFVYSEPIFGEESNRFEADEAEPMLWMSHRGVVAQCHYDESHNFFIQLRGKKRFVLFPPSEASKLYQFPNIHYSYRQSQVSFESPNQTVFRNFPPSPALEVTLVPGDVLYIPPFWFHRVESETFSLSLSVLSPSYEELRLKQAYWELVPFGGLDSVEAKIWGTCEYLWSFIAFSHICAHKHKHARKTTCVRDFFRQLYHTRFEALYPPDLIHKLSDGFSCTLEAPDEAEAKAIKLRTAASKVAEMLPGAEPAPTRTYTHDVVSQWSMDYTEQLLRWAAGTQAAPIILHACLVQGNGFGAELLK